MKTIEAVLTASTSEVVKAATQRLLSYYKEVYFLREDFIYAPGDSPICLVSHMDTVRDRYEEIDPKYARVKRPGDELPVVLELNRNVLTNKNGVLGADDRAGVFGCLELARRCKKNKLPMPSIILTNGEESGGIGVSSFVTAGIFPKKDNNRTRLFVEMDRCNGNEWVTYGARLPETVIQYVESFGFKSGHGSYSDIADLQEAYLIPSVNLSIGYYAQHTACERLHLDEMWLTINRVYQMLLDPIDKLYPTNPKPKYTYGVYNSRDYNTSTGYNRTVIGGGGTTEKKDTDGKAKSGTSGSTSDSSLPSEKKGIKTIDAVIDEVTQGGFCMCCGHMWVECNCGSMLKDIVIYLDDELIAMLPDLYIFKEDGLLYDKILEYLKLAEEAASIITTQVEPADNPAAQDEVAEAADISDPFYVAKEGEQVPLQLAAPTTQKEV